MLTTLLVLLTLTLTTAVTAAAYPTGKRLRALVYLTDPCLARIIDQETAGTWDTTIDFGGGHGNTSESYGLGQANPGTKMAAFGPDWRTNPWTQLRWMRSYAASRYGSACRAWAFWQQHRWW